MQDYDSYSDEALTKLLTQGNLDAFTAIHRRYYGMLYSHAYKRLPDREEVQDILQELFMTIWNKKEDLHIDISLRAYLYTSVRNRILNVFKHQKVKSGYLNSLNEFLANHEPAPDETFRVKELIALVESELNSLPPQMRLIFEMSRNGCFSHREIAEKLHLSPLTVKKQVNNSLKVLRVKLGVHLSSFLFF